MAKLTDVLPIVVLVALSTIRVVFGLTGGLAIASEVFRQKNMENVVIAPEMVINALLQLYVMAKGNTAEEIRDVLKMGLIEKSDLNAIPNDDNIRTYIRFFVANDLNINSDHLKLITLYEKSVERIDYTNPEEATRTINDWIAHRTHNKIQGVIDKVNKDTQIMAIGATAFRKQWEFPFEKVNTRERLFHLANRHGDNKTVRISMMSQKGKFRTIYMKKLDADVVQLSYPTEMLSLVILLPRAENGTDEMVRNLARVDIEDLNLKGPKKDVEIVLPKFKLDFKMGYKKILQSLGIRQLFENPDFGDLTDLKDKVRIEDILQTTHIELNEKGVTCAAVEYIGQLEKIQKIRIFHPFVFLILQDRKLYFAGRVSSLTKN